MSNIIRIRDLVRETIIDTNILIPVDKLTYSSAAKYATLSDIAAYVNTTYTLDNLSDVFLTGLTHGQILRYSGTTWINSNEIYITGGTFIKDTGELILERPNGIVHIDLSAETNDIYFLDSRYAQSLTGLTDINIINATYGDQLIYSGGTWINSTGLTFSGQLTDNGLITLNNAIPNNLTVESGLTYNNGMFNVMGNINTTTLNISGMTEVTGQTRYVVSDSLGNVNYQSWTQLRLPILLEKTVSYTGLTSDCYVSFSGLSLQFTLPLATGSGQVIIVKNYNNDTVTVSGQDGDTIDYVQNYDLTVMGTSVTVVDFKPNLWSIIAKVLP